MTSFATRIATKLNIRAQQAETVLELLAGGATIPFIARYRKDKTGALDEIVIQQIEDESKNLKTFFERKSAIEKSITEQEKMTEALQQQLNNATTLAELEDIYLPYKPKRKTKAQVARENGLEPLAKLILEQTEINLQEEANKYFNETIKSTEEVLQGARDIIAEQINEDVQVRTKMRKLYEEQATLQSKVVSGKEGGGAKYKDYFDYHEPVLKVPSHRALAVLRGFVEGILRITIAPEEDQAIAQMEILYARGISESSTQVKKAIKDAYRRLLQPALETEFRTLLKQRSDEEAINVFSENLKQLLLSAPLGSKRVLAVDPGYRTGCKVVCLGEKGELEKNDLIYIHEPGKLSNSEYTIRHLVDAYRIEAIAIGDGTAGRETEQFIKKLNLNLPVFLVNEDGASIYSASEIAREEFPDLDITVRGAVSIGRRLMDPLAELVKIDPKSIGVGQYQHDVNQFRLKERLDQTVETCVNQVGVNLNTASKHLLGYVSGIGSTLAENIIRYRNENGSFTNRSQLLNIPRLGEKAYEQCAGFLRIKEGNNPLDSSAVHPEAYALVQQMAADKKADVRELIGNGSLIQSINPKLYAGEQFGDHTIQDILKELQKPGLDPRSEARQFEFASIYSIEEVKEGMVLPGIVTNLTRFGAFIDIGVKQDGLVHVSEIAYKFIQDPGEILKLNDQVTVKVLEVDQARKRIALSIKQTHEPPQRNEYRKGHSQTSKRKEEQLHLSDVPLSDALSALKKKFEK